MSGDREVPWHRENEAALDEVGGPILAELGFRRLPKRTIWCRDHTWVVTVVDFHVRRPPSAIDPSAGVVTLLEDLRPWRLRSHEQLSAGRIKDAAGRRGFGVSFWKPFEPYYSADVEGWVRMTIDAALAAERRLGTGAERLHRLTQLQPWGISAVVDGFVASLVLGDVDLATVWFHRFEPIGVAPEPRFDFVRRLWTLKDDQGATLAVVAQQVQHVRRCYGLPKLSLDDIAADLSRL